MQIITLPAWKYSSLYIDLVLCQYSWFLLSFIQTFFRLLHSSLSHDSFIYYQLIYTIKPPGNNLLKVVSYHMTLCNQLYNSLLYIHQDILGDLPLKKALVKALQPRLKTESPLLINMQDLILHLLNPIKSYFLESTQTNIFIKQNIDLLFNIAFHKVFLTNSEVQKPQI